MVDVIKRILDAGVYCDRLLLRKLRKNDAEDMFEYTSDEKTCRYLKWGPHRDIAETEDFITKTLYNYIEPNDIVWGIEEISQRKLIGVVRIYAITENSAEISYILNGRYTGCGYMTETVKAAIKMCFDVLSIDRVVAYYAEGNEASKRVMERCGMEHCQWDGKMEKIRGQSVKINRCEIWRKP